MHFTSVQECVKTLSGDGVPQPPVKRRLPAAEVERAFSVVRSNPEQRRKLEHGEEVDEIETDVGKEVRLDVLLFLNQFRDLKLMNIQGSDKRQTPGLVNFVYGCCFSLLPGFAYSINATWDPPFSRAVYTLQ